MKLDYEEKLKELFKKHMDLGPNRPQREPICIEDTNEGIDEYITDKEFPGYFYHQLEYLKWWIVDDNVVFSSEAWWPTSKSSLIKPCLQHIFYGQDDKLSIILEEFNAYIHNIRIHFFVVVIEALKKMQSTGIRGEAIYLSNDWRKLIEGKYLFGMKVKCGNKMRIESNEKYGIVITIGD